MVVDGDVVTSAGGLTGYEGSLCVVGQLFGQAEADKIGLGVWSEQQECGRFAVKAPLHSDSSEHICRKHSNPAAKGGIDIHWSGYNAKFHCEAGRVSR